MVEPFDPDVCHDATKVVTFILPQMGGPSFRCAAESPAVKQGDFQCGCPICLRDRGMTLIYDPQDEAEAIPIEFRRVRIVSLRTAKFADATVCRGYLDENRPDFFLRDGP